MRQLKPDQEIVCTAELLAVRLDEALPEIGEVRQRVGADHQLVRVGAPVAADRDGFAAPDDLGAALAEAGPAAAGEIARMAG